MLLHRLSVVLCLLVAFAGVLRAQPAPDGQPDLSLRWGGGAFVGAKIFNRSGAAKEDGQNLQISLPCGAATQVTLTIVNTANDEGDFLVRVPAKPAGWSLTATVPSEVYMRETDVTDQLTGDVGWPQHLRGNTGTSIRLLLKAPANVSTLTLGISAINVLSPDQRDYLQLVATSTDAPLPAADLQAKPAGMPDRDYVGVRQFTANKDFQVTGYMLGSNHPAVYLVKLVNTTTAVQTYRMIVPTHPKTAPYQGIVVKMVDLSKDGAEITEALAIPNGWACQMPAGAERLFRVDITNGTPTDTLAFSLPVSVYAGEDRGPLLDTVTVISAFQPALQPDVMAKQPDDAAYIGENILYDAYDPQTVNAQRLRIPFTVNTPVPVLVRIRNVTNQPRSYRISPTPNVPDATELRVFDAPHGGKDVTELVAANAWYTPDIPPNGVFDFWVEFTAVRAAPAYPCTIIALLTNGFWNRDSVWIQFVAAK